MKPNVFIVFVPVDATRQEIEFGLKDLIPDEAADAAARIQEKRTGPDSGQEYPLWTWFVPNPE